jgi:hypothetical protein
MAAPKRKRIIIDAPEEFHMELKSYAARRGITIKAYVTGAILEQIKRDKQYE